MNISLGGLPTALLALPFGILGAIALPVYGGTVFSCIAGHGHGVTYPVVSVGVMFAIGGLILHHQDKRRGVCRW